MVKKAKGQCTLQAWEETNGELTLEAILPWVESQQLSHHKIVYLIEEFRLRMMASGKKYLDFRLAFYVYIRNGWLGMTINQLKVDKSKLASVFHTKGIRL